MTTIQIKPGHYYRLRNGITVGPMRRLIGPSAFHWGTPDGNPCKHTCMDDGSFYQGGPSEYDIVEDLGPDDPTKNVVEFDGTREHAWKLGFYQLINNDGLFCCYIHNRAYMSEIRPVKGTRLVVGADGIACGLAHSTDIGNPIPHDPPSKAERILVCIEEGQIVCRESKWFWCDETWTEEHGPYTTAWLAYDALIKYCEKI